MLHTVIFIGRSGCGKGTQADLFKEWLRRRDTERRQILYVETGDRFRRFIQGEGYSSRLSEAMYERDELQPDFLAVWMWGSVLIEELEDDMHLVFDGVARSLEEARVLTTAMRFYGRGKPTVVYLDVSRKWSEERLLARGRRDDRSLSKITKRLDWFDKDVMPAIEYFRQSPEYRFLEIDGEQSIEEVHMEIVRKFESL